MTNGAEHESGAPRPTEPGSVLYGESATEYAADVESNPFTALYERPGVIALLPPVAGRQVLDAGCGPGPLSEWLVRQGADVTGFDASAGMVRLARERCSGSASFMVADLAEPLDFLADDAFDVIVASLVLHYLRDWVAPLRELRRVLRPDGRFVFSTHHPAMDVRLSRSGDYFATELLHDRFVKAGRGFDVRFWRRPLQDMFAALSAAGFRVEQLSEPQPLPECRERFPDVWTLLITQPRFLFFRLAPC